MWPDRRRVASDVTSLDRAASLRPLEPPETYKTVPRRVRDHDGQIRSRPY